MHAINSCTATFVLIIGFTMFMTWFVQHLSPGAIVLGIFILLVSMIVKYVQVSIVGEPEEVKAERELEHPTEMTVSSLEELY